MADDVDGYEAYYSAKLWSLLPQIYRTYDATGVFDPNASSQPNGPLRELVDRIGAQAANLRRSIDRLWEDQSIETCDDWVIPYIGAQVAVNLVSGLNSRSQRLSVFKTIYYRQRKGAIPLLEELALDITGWNARVVEMYRRLGRARHGLDPPLGWPIEIKIADARGVSAPSLAVASGIVGANTRTCAGGYADLRNDYGASRCGTAFDELSYAADVRLGSGTREWFNISNLGIFLWRLQSVPVTGVTPVAATGGGQFTFDPTGRDVPLFSAGIAAYDANVTQRQEFQLPGPIDSRLLAFALPELYAIGGSFGLYDGPSGDTLIPLDQISADPRDITRFVIDPARGRVTTPARSSPTSGLFLVSYSYGFSSAIGAGGYDRLQGKIPTTVAPLLPKVTGGGANMVSTAEGTVEIGDSRTYDGAPDYTIGGAGGGNSLILRASNGQRPLFRFAPTSAGPRQWTFTGSLSNGIASRLRLDGLFVAGADVVLAGQFEEVVLSTCTLDPGSWDGAGPRLAIDGRPLVPCHLTISGTVRNLIMDRCILGPIVATGRDNIERTAINDSIIQVVNADDAVAIVAGETSISRCTILGEARFHRLQASDSLFRDVVSVADIQTGCVRFSAWPDGSALPRQYQCVELESGRALFASTDFGKADYARLLPSVDARIGAGAEDDSEMGVFSREKNPIKERSLLIKYQEFLPIGVNPVLIYVT